MTITDQHVRFFEGKEVRENADGYYWKHRGGRGGEGYFDRYADCLQSIRDYHHEEAERYPTPPPTPTPPPPTPVPRARGRTRAR